MCLLTFSPAGVSPDAERLWNASINNPHGFGFAVRTPNGIVRSRGMDFERVYDNYEATLKRYHGESMFHLRWATHGTVNKANCHPFYVGSDKDTMLGHNGIIPIEIPKGDARSDTRYFSEVLMPKSGGVSMLDNPEYVDKLEKVIGASKLVILTNNSLAQKPFYIVNEDMGHWDSDSWWSNFSYKKYTHSYTTPKDDLFLDEWSFILPCPLCDVDIIVNEAKGETHCPTCDVCLLCEEDMKYCYCELWADDRYENTVEDDEEQSLIPYQPYHFY
jgi:glutamine amidotransferase